MNVLFYPINPKYQKSGTITSSYLSPTFEGGEGDTFVSENKQPKEHKTLIDKLRSTFSKNDNYINEAKAMKILAEADEIKLVSLHKKILNPLKEDNGYSKSTINDVAQIIKLIRSIPASIMLERCNVNINNDEINHESQRAFISACLELLNKGVSRECVEKIFWELKLPSINYPPDAAKLLTLDLPEEKNESLLAEFIKFRFNVTMGINDINDDYTNVTPDMEKFNALTYAFKINNRLHNYDDFNAS